MTQTDALQKALVRFGAAVDGLERFLGQLFEDRDQAVKLKEQLRALTDGPDADYRKLVVTLGVEAAVANRTLSIQSVITTQVDAARESVAGVNIDEEMTNMLSFQHAYSAAARLVTSIDEMLDQLINRTGRVGL